MCTEPTPGTDRRAETEKRVGWAELFFDLVVVFAVTQPPELDAHRDQLRAR